MKRIAVCGLFLLFGFIAVGAEETGKQLIVIFPVSSLNSITGDVDSITHASGNTISMAQIIIDLTGADVFEIELESPYSSRYSTVLTEAKDDQKKRARPTIKGWVADMDTYDTIYLGFPNWWASIPMPIAAFLESYDLKGKKIIPFCTHGGGRFGQSISAIAKLSPSAMILTPFEAYYGGGSSLRSDMRKWLIENEVPVK